MSFSMLLWLSRLLKPPQRSLCNSISHLGLKEIFGPSWRVIENGVSFTPFILQEVTTGCSASSSPISEEGEKSVTSGHALNLAMAALSILIHAVRLNTLEFSNHKGVSWAGYAFSPFKTNKETEK